MHNIFRPKSWENFLGQEHIIESLKVYTKSALLQQTCLDNILISGPSGMGKTSLAYLVSNVLKTKIHIVNGTNLTKPSDLISIITAIKENEILFIDEVHSVNKEVLEVIYPVLEDNRISIIIGKDYNSKIVNVKLPRFTTIVATTEVNKLSFPFINRFSIFFQLSDYTKEDLRKIVEMNARKLNLDIPHDSQNLIASYCRNTPRIAINLIKRINDYVLTEEIKDFNVKSIESVFKKMKIYKYGLYEKDFEYLKKLNDFKYLGVENMSQMINIPIATIINNIEPILVKENLIIRTIRGRSLTNKGYEYLNESNF